MDSSSWPTVAAMPLGASFGSEQHRSYFAPFVVYGLPVDVVPSQEETQARYAESGERRVMISSNSDGRAYSRGEFLEHFGKAIGLREWEKAVPVLAPSFHHMMGRRPQPEPGSLDTYKDVSGVFNDIKRALMRILDEAEKDEVPWRRFRVRNEKITRSALVWNRLCRKLLVLLINNRVERLSFDSISDIGA